MRRRQALGGVPKNFKPSLPSVEKVKEWSREDGRLDAMDVTFGEEPTRTCPDPDTCTKKQYKLAYSGYTQEHIAACLEGYREGYDRYMKEYGDGAGVA